MQSRLAEASIYNNFLNNSQNTHTTAVTNSVGMVIARLLTVYFKEERTPAVINKKYTDSLAEIRRFATTEERTGALNFLIHEAAELLTRWDEVFLYLPDDNGNYKNVMFTFPLILVIPLVWTALKHHEKYAHHYQGDATQRLMQARGDYNKRVDDLFRVLIEIRNDQLCHTGPRHELVFLLNKTYEGIEIIEDARAAVAAMLKENTNALFWEHFKNAPTPAIKQQLTGALYTWMGDNNPAPLLELVDDRQTALEKISTLFIRHGSDPAVINVKNLIAECLPTLNFSYEPQHFPIIRVIENIFNSANETNDELMQAALHNIKRWITQHATLDDEKIAARLGEVYALYVAHTSLNEQTILQMQVSGDMQGSYYELKNYARNYFYHIQIADLETGFSTPDAAQIETAAQLQQSIFNCKSNKLVDFIENFFARWTITVTETSHPRRMADRRYLYRFLMDATFHEKVLYSDAEIIAFLQQDPDTNSREISVYQINRAFLHALLMPFSTWTDKFHEFINSVFDFVKNGIAGKLEMTHAHLCESSYTPRLIKSLTQIITNQQRDRDSGHYDEIFLPHHIETGMHWLHLSSMLDDEKRAEIYIPQAVRINHMLGKELSQRTIYLEKAFHSMPSQYRLRFLKHAMVEAVIESMLNHPGIDKNTYRTIIVDAISHCIPPDSRLAAWRHINTYIDTATVTAGLTMREDQVATLLLGMPEDDRKMFIRLFPDCFNLTTAIFDSDDWQYLPNASLIMAFKNVLVTFATDMTIFFIQDMFPKILAKLKNNNDIYHQVMFLAEISKYLGMRELFYTLDEAFLDTLQSEFPNHTRLILERMNIMPAEITAREGWLDEMAVSDEIFRRHFLMIQESYRITFLIVAAPHCLNSSTSVARMYHIHESVPIHAFKKFENSPVGIKLLTSVCQAQILDEDKIAIIKIINGSTRKKYHTALDLIDWRSHLVKTLILLPLAERFDYFYEKAQFPNFVDACIARQVPFQVLMQSFRTDQIQKIFLLLGDNISRLIASRALDLTNLNLEDNTEFVNIRRYAFIKTFTAIYDALWEGQTSFFKSGHWMRKNQHLIAVNTDEFIMRLIFAHGIKPGSRSAQALAIMANHSKHNRNNSIIMENIYQYTYARSGLLKRAINKNQIAADRFHQVDGSLIRRRDKIFAAIQQIPDQQECLTAVRNARL